MPEQELSQIFEARKGVVGKGGRLVTLLTEDTDPDVR